MPALPGSAGGGFKIKGIDYEDDDDDEDEKREALVRDRDGAKNEMLTGRLNALLSESILGVGLGPEGSE